MELNVWLPGLALLCLTLLIAPPDGSNIRLHGQDRTVVLDYRNGQPHRGSDHSAQ